MEDLELISLLNECNKMSVLEVSNYLLGKMDYLSRIKSDKSNKILKYIESFVWMINHAGNRRHNVVESLMITNLCNIYRETIFDRHEFPLLFQKYD